LGGAERSGERELQKNDGAERSAEQEVAERGAEVTKNPLERGAAFSPLTLRSHALGVDRTSPYDIARSSYRNKFSLNCILNNFIHHKSGSNKYKDKLTNITKLTLSSTYINRYIMVNHVSECVYTLSYQPNYMRLKISF